MHVLYPLIQAQFLVVCFLCLCSYLRSGQCPTPKGRSLYGACDVKPQDCGFVVIRIEVFHDFIDTARDFRMFTFAPVASS